MQSLKAAPTMMTLGPLLKIMTIHTFITLVGIIKPCGYRLDRGTDRVAKKTHSHAKACLFSDACAKP